MRGHGWVGAAIAGLFLLSFIGRGQWVRWEEGTFSVDVILEGLADASSQGDRTGSFHLVGQRIVSLAPSITETLFIMGLGDRVVGVSRFCDWPPEVAHRPQVGGLFDPNLEQILRLEPDLVVGLQGQPDTLWPIRKLGLPLVVVDHRSIDGLLESIGLLGRVCGRPSEAERLLEDIRQRLQAVSLRISGRVRPKVLVCVQRNVGTGRIENVYISGREGHLGRIVQLAGGESVVPSTWAAFPMVSAESLLRLDPDVILDLVPGFCSQRLSREQILADWQSLAGLRAVREGRVYVLDEDFVFRPSPRFILLVEKLAPLLHPEAFAQHSFSRRQQKPPDPHTKPSGNPWGQKADPF
ncbi:MAG: helical backbone metal receptor [Thermoguttaceae bacterium]|nr:helical backbone metal receptor [Thermoguttaceae bacterium]MDW8038884.1 helical backbone metal receptor [Thermoguttaceae bacterium]